MDLLNHGKRVSYQVFLLFLLQCTTNFTCRNMYKRLREFEEICKTFHEFDEIEISKAKLYTVQTTVNSKEENFKYFCLDFVQEFGLRTPVTFCLTSEYKENFVYILLVTFLLDVGQP
jgi:hypothetical protein